LIDVDTDSKTKPNFMSKPYIELTASIYPRLPGRNPNTLFSDGSRRADISREEEVKMGLGVLACVGPPGGSDTLTAVGFYIELARNADGPLVELAIGNGRVAIPVAQATGQRVIGIDSSPAMLEQAHARAAEAGVELELHEGDMRDIALDEPAALIYCPFRALLHLPTWADRRRTFERVAASLRPGGRFAWNAFAFDHQIAARVDGEHQDHPVPHTIRYSVGDNRMDIALDDGARSSLWWATRNEWLGLLDVAGLELDALYVASLASRSQMTAANMCSSPATRRTSPRR
jgi:SAM-dependent methyltransferase